MLEGFDDRTVIRESRDKKLTVVEGVGVNTSSFGGDIPHLFYGDTLADCGECEYDLEEHDDSEGPFGETSEGWSDSCVW